MNCVRGDTCVYHFCWVFSPGVFLSSRVTGACPVTTDLIMRANVRTTTTTKYHSWRNDCSSWCSILFVISCWWRHELRQSWCMRGPPWVVCVFPGVFLSSRVTGACPVTTDLNIRANVRTSTTTTCHSWRRNSCLHQKYIQVTNSMLHQDYSIAVSNPCFHLKTEMFRGRSSNNSPELCA